MISTQNGSTSRVNLTQNTIWTMTGNSTATTVINDNSQIIYTTPTGDPTQLASYKTLTAGNYTGTNGTIGLNTFLGADNSPSDKLIINGGSATGNSLLRITNAGGPGAETVANGIPVVQVMGGGTTAPGAFALAGEVRGGAFDYDLFRGGLNGSSPNDWFLRSSFVVGPPVSAAGRRRPRRACRPTRRRSRCRPASIRSSGRRSRPTAWSNRSPGNWG